MLADYCCNQSNTYLTLNHIIMKTIGLLIISGIMLLSCNQVQDRDMSSEQGTMSVSETESARDGVFIHITESYDDPHRVLMPLRMATMMAEDKNVLVYLDIDAVEFIEKDADDINYADFESAHTYIEQLIDANVGVYACPTCLEVAGISQDNLLDGVQTAEKEKFFNFTDGRIITLDY